ncbi:thermonuclease family protein [Chloroflexi bacterium TSY]|nr:thermonuclease family protein [Chloroflexi bacterium TSY]
MLGLVGLMVVYSVIDNLVGEPDDTSSTSIDTELAASLDTANNPAPTNTLSPTDTQAPTSTPTALSESVDSLSIPTSPTSLPTNTLAPPPTPAQNPLGQPAQVTNIVDGDTIDVVINGTTYRVRYILIDTPERGDNYFNEATEANRQLVGGKIVYLQKDVSETDRFGRLLRYIYLDDGTFVNAEMVRRGLAVLSTYPPDVSKEAEIRAAQQQAVAAEVRIWSQPVGPVANRNSNLRGGPGTNYAIVGSAQGSQALNVVARNTAGDWYQLDNGAWIAAFLVDNAPDSLPIIIEPPTLQPTPPPPTTATLLPAPVQQSRGNCDPSYPTVCIPPSPPDLDCGEIPYRRFQVIGSDPHRFDGDNDGIGCER